MFKPQLRFFGGALLKGKRRTLRPLTTKEAIHFTLRSEWATKNDSFLIKRNYKPIEHIIERFAKKFGIRIYRQAINSNHIHLLLRITNRTLYRAFIRAIAGKIASHVMSECSFKEFRKAKQNLRQGDGAQSESFWQYRPFSRIVSWGRDFKGCAKYLKQNVLEAWGFINYTPRVNPYSKWLVTVLPVLSTDNKNTS